METSPVRVEEGADGGQGGRGQWHLRAIIPQGDDWRVQCFLHELSNEDTKEKRANGWTGPGKCVRWGLCKLRI